MYAQIIKNITDYIHHCEMYSVVAGGALRDIDHGLTPKDIDIFVLVEPHKLGFARDRFHDACEEWLTDFRNINDSRAFADASLTTRHVPEDVPEEYRNNLNGTAFRVENFSLYQNHRYIKEIQVIFYDPNRLAGYNGDVVGHGEAGRLILSSFDLNTSKVFTYRTGTNNQDFAYKLVKHPEYNLGKRHKVMWPVNVDPTGNTIDRLHRIARKLECAVTTKHEGESNELFEARIALQGANWRRVLQERQIARAQAQANEAQRMAQQQAQLAGYAGNIQFDWGQIYNHAARVMVNANTINHVNGLFNR